MPSKDLVKPVRGELVGLGEQPSFIAQADNREGTAELSRIVRPSFVKLIQKMSADELTSNYGVGSLLLTPDNIPLTTGQEGSIARFVPIMFYTEYCKWSPIILKGNEPMISERSFDPNSEVGRKSSTPETWSERHPQHADDPRYNYRYCEHLNYIIKLVDEDLMHTEPCLVSFSKSSYVAGQRLAKLAIARQKPIYAGVYELSSRDKTNQQGTFKVFTTENARERAWVSSEELFLALKQLHAHYRDLVKQQMVRAEYDIDAVVVEEEIAGSTGKY